MLRRALGRAASGFAYGVLSGQVTAIIISLCIGDGRFHQVVPDFRLMFDTELAAVVTQTLLPGVLGAVFAACSVVFEIEEWGLTTQYLLYFAITSAFWVPIVYLCWRPQTMLGFMVSLASFTATYFTVWLVQFLISRKDIARINERIRSLDGNA